MRLWHWKLIPVLPRQQLLGQWRECCAIARNISEKETPNHILVNPILDYPICEFFSYTREIITEMKKRGYFVQQDTINNFCNNLMCKYSATDIYKCVPIESVFSNWHDDQYLKQCYYNLQEKHDRGGISDEEWQKIQEVVHPNQISETLEELHKQQLFMAIGDQYRLSNGIPL